MQIISYLFFVNLLTLPFILYCAKAEVINPESVSIVAHRGICGSAPENSISSFKECIHGGIDYIELDVRKTKDDHLIVMHDARIDRTTNAKGNIKNYTKKELQKFFLRNQDGSLSSEKIPTLQEVFRVLKGKIKINIDDKENLYDEIIALAKQENILSTLLFKSKNPAQIDHLRSYGDQINFMPIFVNFSGTKRQLFEMIESYQKDLHVVAVELVFKSKHSVMLSQDVLSYFKRKNIAIWVNTLSPELCANLDDKHALKYPDLTWGYFIHKGFNLIQTDYPLLLKNFLLTRS